MTSDSEDPNDDVQYHLEVGEDDVADSVLQSGNPERVERSTTTGRPRHRAEHREYRQQRAIYDGTPISVTSTGIGSPSAAIAIEELARVEAQTLIRVGSCGRNPRRRLATWLSRPARSDRRAPLRSTSARTIPPCRPRIVSALVAAAEELGYDYHLGVTCSTDSFYAGQSRPGFEDFEASGSDERIAALQEAGVLNFEMEAATILTLANLYGLRAGAVCTVYANRRYRRVPHRPPAPRSVSVGCQSCGAARGCRNLAERSRRRRSTARLLNTR
ncbi:uridine phosphorylase [Halogeometricum sp. wsp3]|nr:uridine phosphorylase [Halogeometricum sp. wsp3]